MCMICCFKIFIYIIFAASALSIHCSAGNGVQIFVIESCICIQYSCLFCLCRSVPIVGTDLTNAEPNGPLYLSDGTLGYNTQVCETL